MIPEYLHDVAATGAEVSIIAEPRQVVIDGRGCAIDDRHLADISQEKDLTWLSLYNCRVSNFGALKLMENHRLEYLDLGLTDVDGSILSIVPALGALGGIGLTGIRKINQGISFLTLHPSLDNVDLSESDITAENLRHLLLNSNITAVQLKGTTVLASDVRDLDDIKAEPYRTVTLRLSDTERLAVVMPWAQNNSS
jgi:hypothetical protein